MKAEEVLQRETGSFEGKSRFRDDVLDAMEQYANQRVIEELDEVIFQLNMIGSSNPLILELFNKLNQRIKELKTN